MNLGLSPLDDDLDLLMNRYSRFKDQKIRFTEFAYLFMPKSESLASSLKTSASDS